MVKQLKMTDERERHFGPQANGPAPAIRAKTCELPIHEMVPLRRDDLPAGTRFLGYEDFTVDHLRVEPHNTRYRRGRYHLPNGTFVTAPLPKVTFWRSLHDRIHGVHELPPLPELIRQKTREFSPA